MNFRVSKSELKNALSTVSRVTGGKTSTPALECVLFELSSGSLKLTGYDLNLGIITEISAETFDNGKFLMQPKTFNLALSKMSKDDICIEVENDIATITNGKTVLKLPTMSADDYPEIPAIAMGEMIEIEQHILKDMISKTLYAVATNEIKPILTGELFEISEGQLRLVAIDGFRMALSTEKINTSLRTNAVVPGKALAEIKNVLTDGLCQIGLQGKHCRFDVGRYTIFSRILVGEFHNYENSIPRENRIEVIIETKPLIDSLDRCSMLISDRIKAPVRCLFENGQLCISCKTTLGSIDDKIDCEVIGGALEIGFNNKYLMDSIKATGSEKVKILMGGATNPATIVPIKSNEYTMLVLPVRLK